MKALLSTTRVLSAVTLAAVGFATAMLVAIVLTASPDSPPTPRSPRILWRPNFREASPLTVSTSTTCGAKSRGKRNTIASAPGSATPCAGAGPPACPGVQAC